MNNRTQKATLEEMLNDDATGAQTAIMCFELWQDMIINGAAPDPKRYKSEFLDYYKDIIAGEHAPFYSMFMGFLGGMDFALHRGETKEDTVE